MTRRFRDPALGALAEQASALDATMIIPLLIAAALGAGRAASGIIGAHKQGVQDRTLIKRAYQISNRRMNESQAYTRQGANESLNARGVLNGGSNVKRSAAVAAGYGAGATADKTRTDFASAKGVMNKIKVASKGGDPDVGDEQRTLAQSSEAGQTGDGSTISGQANSDLSREFFGEHQDLASQRDQGLTASQRAQSAATVNAIGSGIDVGTSVYQAGSLIQGALGSGQAAVPGTPAAVTPAQPIKPGNWFGGYDPVDPLGLSKRKISNDQFNVKSGG